MARTIISTKSQIIIQRGTTPVAGANVILLPDANPPTIEVLAEIHGQVLASALDDFWHSNPGMSLYRFPMYAVDEDSEKYLIGYDGTYYNSWQWKNTSTKKNIKFIGWRQFDASGVIREEWYGVTTPPTGVPDTAQPFYVNVSGGSPINFSFQGAVNEPILVYKNDGINPVTDTRNYLKIYAKEFGYKFADADLASVSRVATGPYSQAFGLNVTVDDKITLSEATLATSPYTLLTYHKFNVGASSVLTDFVIGSTTCRFYHTVDNTAAHLDRFEIYQVMQYKFKQNANINAEGTPTVIGKTSDAIMWFVGSTLYSKAYIKGLLTDDINDIVYVDYLDNEHRYPYSATGIIRFNSIISAAPSAKYTMVFTNPTAAPGDEWGTAGALIVQDKDGNPITGDVASNSSIGWAVDHDGNTQGGRTPGTDMDVAVIVTAPGAIRYKSVTYTIKRSTGQIIDVNGLEAPYYVA